MSVAGVVAFVINEDRVKIYGKAFSTSFFTITSQGLSGGGDIPFMPHLLSIGVNVSGIHSASIFLRVVFRTSIFWITGGKPATALSSFVAT